jgi:hypothetical protein
MIPADRYGAGRPVEGAISRLNQPCVGHSAACTTEACVGRIEAEVLNYDGCCDGYRDSPSLLCDSL